LAILINCNTRENKTSVYNTEDCNTEFKRISIKSLSDSVSFYDRKRVEISGYYSYSIEQSALFTGETYNSNEFSLWVEFSTRLIDSLVKKELPGENVFNKMSGKTVKIRGMLISDSHGHLGQYSATVKDVCYLEISNGF
jgi:hypothetical protein